MLISVCVMVWVEWGCGKNETVFRTDCCYGVMWGGVVGVLWCGSVLYDYMSCFVRPFMLLFYLLIYRLTSLTSAEGGGW